MLFKAEIDVMPLTEILDPQGKAVLLGLHNLGHTVSEVRIGRHITLRLEADSDDDANRQVEQACQGLLHNPIMEQFTFRIEPLPAEVDE